MNTMINPTLIELHKKAIRSVGNITGETPYREDMETQFHRYPELVIRNLGFMIEDFTNVGKEMYSRIQKAYVDCKVWQIAKEQGLDAAMIYKLSHN